MTKRLFTSESVTEGHPDKVCDRISDAVLDAILAEDPMARVACEAFATTDFVAVMGEITTKANINIPAVVRDAVRYIGYTKPGLGFNAESCEILCKIKEQSPDIAMGVNNSLETRGSAMDADTGAGDQGMMFGYACDETPEKMPMPIMLAHKMAMELTRVRKNGTLPYLRPDGKTQVTVEYDGDKPVRIEAVVVSTQHDPEVSMDKLSEDIKKWVIAPILPPELVTHDTKYFINPTGRFVMGGPHGDCGLTGRKIIVDTYGGYARHGGGAFSGKDPTKVDRSGAYMARYIAKNIVAAGLAKRCEIQLAYAIGVAQPVSVMVDTFGTGTMSEEDIACLVREHFDLRPAAIIRDLNLRRPIYKGVSSYGHLGREDLDVPWERTDKVPLLKA